MSSVRVVAHDLCSPKFLVPNSEYLKNENGSEMVLFGAFVNVIFQPYKTKYSVAR